MQRKSAGRSIGLESDVIDVESERPDRDLQRSIWNKIAISARKIKFFTKTSSTIFNLKKIKI